MSMTMQEKWDKWNEAEANYEDYYKRKGVTKDLVDVYEVLAKVLFNECPDKKYAVRISSRARDLIEELACKETEKQDIWHIERLIWNKGASYPYLDRYYDLLLLEAPYHFESFLFYMEKLRPQDKRFYWPRRKTLKIVADDLQDLEDGVIKFYGLSMPSRVGKLLADDTPVLTTKGWKKHGDLIVGDYVYGADGKPKMVQAVGKKYFADCRVYFSNGETIDCHKYHEWVVIDEIGNTKVIETQELFACKDISTYLCPRLEIDNNHKRIDNVYICKVEHIEPKQGNCIQVDGGVYCAGKTCLPTHNSTICIFFLAWVMGRSPNKHSAMGGHSGILAKGFYGELLNLIETEEYTYAEIFPNLIRRNGNIVQRKSADEFTINLDKPDRFSTLTCRGIDGTWTGAVDISPGGYLYVDDLVRDREHSLSPTRMEGTFQEYLNKMVDRKNDGAKELMVGTLWSVLDPLSRIAIQYDGNPKYRFRKIPALNENDESNFDYIHYGFSTQYYRDMRERLDNAEWMAKYQQQPYVREGLLFEEDGLRFFNGILPEGDSRVVAVCDVAWGGGDSLSMPIGREYENGDVYIFDWVFNKGAKEETVPIVCGKIVANEIRQINFEGNVGGAMYSYYIDEKLQEQGYKCNCTEKKAPNKMSKIEKIMAYSGDIKRRFVFLAPNGKADAMFTDDSLDKDTVRYRRSADYQRAMEELQMFVTVGKNPHDDAADSLTQLAMFIEGTNSAKVELFDRRFIGI